MAVKKHKVTAATTTTSAKDDTKATLVTKEGLIALKKELEYLETVRRREIAAKIKEAVSYGDLSENSEYEEAKNDQAFVEGRIMQLTEQIKYAKIIDESTAGQQAKKDVQAQLGNKVRIKCISGKLVGETMEYFIVGTTEADPLNEKISNESPVGVAIIGSRIGDTIEVKVPSGTVTYQILSIS